MDNLDQRFPYVLDAFSVLQPDHLQEPVGDKLKIICQHYEGSPLALDSTGLDDEWEEFTSFAKEHAPICNATPMQAVAKVVSGNTTIAELYPLIAKLYSRAVTMPVSTTVSERF